MEYYSNENTVRQGYTYHDDRTANVSEAGIEATRNKRFDVLSFLSAIVQLDDKSASWNGLVFLSIHLGPWNSLQLYPPYRGAFFAVTVLESKYILRETAVPLDTRYPVSSIIALKTPILDQELGSLRNTKLFRSIAKEVQILRSEHLQNHDHIVNVFGCCWQSLDTDFGVPFPCIILEGSEYGNLVQFCRNRNLTLRKRLRICLQISSGLQAIHSVCIIHGDVKPENILMFHSKAKGYTAKIADFGEAMLMTEENLPTRRPQGTILYSAPECYEPDALFDQNALCKMDIYSLGITIAFLVQGNHIVEEMRKLPHSRLQALKCNSELPQWLANLQWALEKPPFEDNQDKEISDAWITDPSWLNNSIVVEPGIWSSYLQLNKDMLASNVGQGYCTVERALSDLRLILRLHLRALLRTTTQEQHTRVSNPTNLVKNTGRKDTGGTAQFSSHLKKAEIKSIALSCQSPRDFLKEACFVARNTPKRRLQRRDRCLIISARFKPSKRSRKRASASSKSILATAKKLIKLFSAWKQEQRQINKAVALEGLEKTIFKPMSDNRLFWILPGVVKELLKAQLLHEATKPSIGSQQADAAYGYATVVFSSAEPLALEIPAALDNLALAASKGHLEAQYSVSRLSRAFSHHLGIPPEFEMDWLQTAFEAGSMTAHKQFEAIDSKRFSKALHQARRTYGHICPKLNRILLQQCEHILQSTDVTVVWCAMFFKFFKLAILGDYESFKKLPEFPADTYNCQNAFGETPLLVACRGGHVALAEMLLERGACPTIATQDDVTPLHFLAAFDEDQIPRLASLLLQKGAKLDKASKTALMYKETQDSPFGIAGGTPLLWAVAARSRCAVQTLMERGADPFAMEPNHDSFEPRYCPLSFAASFHQHNLLEIMLSCARGSRANIERRLNETIASDKSNILLLYATIDCNPGIRFRECLIHGAYSERAALRSVQILLKYGADPTMSTKDRAAGIQHPIVTTCLSGNMLTLRYLWDYKEGLLRPPPKIWYAALHQSIFNSFRTAFDFLLDHRGDVAIDVDLDLDTIAAIFKLTNDRYYILKSLKLLEQPGTSFSPRQHKDLFVQALTRGHYEAAKLIFQKGKFQATSRIGSETFLGLLIGGGSILTANVEKMVSLTLSLSSDLDSLFWNVSSMKRETLTALHAIVWICSRRRPMDAGIFNTIIQQFGAPKYLNAQIGEGAIDGFAGFSALHLAVKRGNTEAAILLLDQPGIDLNIQSCDGQTPLDMCIDLELDFVAQQDLRNDRPHSPQRWANLSILNGLISSGGTIAKFSTVIMRLNHDNFNLLERGKAAVQSVNLREQCQGSLGLLKPSHSLIINMPIGGFLTFTDTPSEDHQWMPKVFKSLFALLGFCKPRDTPKKDHFRALH